jgi:ATP-dependent RNA helicase DHX29
VALKIAIMAKKKKPAANPARGFATTSIASKPKPTVDVEKPPSNVVLPSKDAEPPSNTGVQRTNLATSEKPKEKDLHELTPDELTEQLERNELQRFVDTYGSKVRREVSRLDSKLRTDNRVLRSQAEAVSLGKWLPEELMTEILETIRTERNDANKIPSKSNASNQPEELLLFRCWTLWESLVDFGVPRDSVGQAVRAVIENPPQQDSGPYIWGFKESIDLLALDLDETSLPPYDERKSRVFQSTPSSMENSGINTSTESATVSTETSPRYVLST